MPLEMTQPGPYIEDDLPQDTDNLSPDELSKQSTLGEPSSSINEMAQSSLLDFWNDESRDVENCSSLPCTPVPLDDLPTPIGNEDHSKCQRNRFVSALLVLMSLAMLGNAMREAVWSREESVGTLSDSFN